MKKRKTTAIAVLMILTGLSLLLYPIVSDYLRNLAFRRVISDYAADVEPMDEEKNAELLAAARTYNERLAGKVGPLLALSDEEQAQYNSLLKIDSTGIMGYLSIPQVNISLPIYHGIDAGVLQSGVGHLESTSLPIGGPGTHAVLTAHTGLPSAKLFTNIDRLAEGDTFTLRVLKETLTYQVDQIQVVLPEQTDALLIQPGEDCCTLVTCTPYGVNTHRLLVRGHRVPTLPELEQTVGLEKETMGLDAEPALLIIAALLLTLLMSLRWRKQMWKWAKRLTK